jgi:hypothetical protein
MKRAAGFHRSLEALCTGLLFTIISVVSAPLFAAPTEITPVAGVVTASTNDTNVPATRPTPTPTPGPGGIDWSQWSLQLPNGTTVNPATTRNAWFYPNGNYQAFMDPKTGKTTSGSKHPRSELRQNATWSSSGANTLDVTVRVAKIGSGRITIGQVFCKSGSKGARAHTLLELQYSTSGFVAFYEKAKGAGSYTHIGSAPGLGTTFTYQLAFSAKKLTVKINGVTRWTKTPGAAGSSGAFYFKAGNYDQSAISGPVSTKPYSIVEMSVIRISNR